MGFSWKNHIVKTEKKLIYRTKILAKTNPDFIAAHADLSREAEKGITNVEAKAFVKKIMAKRIKYGKVPKNSVVIQRFNRVV